jgi:hypothetical protein
MSKKCKHEAVGPVSECTRCGEHAVMWVDIHGLNMANVFFQRPMRRDCRRCGAHNSLGAPNDWDTPSDEFGLADAIRDLCAKWEASGIRDAMVDEKAEEWT